MNKIFTEQKPNVLICNSVDELMTALLGAPQQDEHMKKWRWHTYCQGVYGFTPKRASE